MASNDDFIEGEKTALASSALVGQKTLNVLNGLNFASVNHLRLGRKGDNITELCHIDSINGNVITLKANLNNTHPENTEVVELYYDQRKLYKEQTAGAGDYAVVGSPKDIQLDNPDGTIFKDQAGVNGIYYKCTYYDSVGLTETSLDDAVAVTGDDTAYASISDIRQEAGFSDNAFISDADILKDLQASTDEINGRIAPIYVLPLPYIPQVIRDIATHLTIGRLFHNEYPGIDAAYALEGEGRMKEGRALLDKIYNRQVLLLDANGVELVRVQTNKPSGWPNNSTANLDSQDHGGDNMFRIGMRF